jgi:hypothetical protein
MRTRIAVRSRMTPPYDSQPKLIYLKSLPAFQVHGQRRRSPVKAAGTLPSQEKAM